MAPGSSKGSDGQLAGEHRILLLLEKSSSVGAALNGCLSPRPRSLPLTGKLRSVATAAFQPLEVWCPNKIAGPYPDMIQSENRIQPQSDCKCNSLPILPTMTSMTFTRRHSFTEDSTAPAMLKSELRLLRCRLLLQ